MTTRDSVGRLRGAKSGAEASATEFADDVRYYLTLRPRQLPSRYLYDALGSALFEAICHLPWYPLTRAEGRLLQAHRRAVLAHLAPVTTIIELGCGSGDKLRLLLEAADRRGGGPLTVHLIDVSASALASSARALAEIEDVVIVSHQASYERGLADAARHPRGEGRTLALFLGSNIGNFDPPGSSALLHAVRARLAPGDALLVGADLVKSERELLLAYDDPLGLTAAFNRNLLIRINRELGGDFDVERFGHRAVWNAAESRVEMYLVARRSQRIRIEAAELDVELADGEPIWTESSYKYRPESVVAFLERAGFRRIAQWVDERDGFALTLVQAA